ncbi:MAG: hypothetical protein JXB42_12435 [Deltaproteobacteria bacterium]|nr:hypothetical protein [Deltaproteobacteria bacterium]
MKQKAVTLCLAICLIAGVIAFATPAVAATQGEVALKLAEDLGLDTSSIENAIAALVTVGIVPGGGWNAGAVVDAAFAGSLFTAVNAAAESGAISAPSTLATASALTAAALTAAGVDATTAVTGIVAAGGNQTNAQSGATIGTTTAASGTSSGTSATTGTVAPDATPPAGTGGGGSGTQSS